MCSGKKTLHLHIIAQVKSLLFVAYSTFNNANCVKAALHQLDIKLGGFISTLQYLDGEIAQTNIAFSKLCYFSFQLLHHIPLPSTQGSERAEVPQRGEENPYNGWWGGPMLVWNPLNEKPFKNDLFISWLICGVKHGLTSESPHASECFLVWCTAYMCH